MIPDSTVDLGTVDDIARALAGYGIDGTDWDPVTSFEALLDVRIRRTPALADYQRRCALGEYSGPPWADEPDEPDDDTRLEEVWL